MNTRKLAASLTAVVCSMGMLSYLPSFLAPVSAVELVHNDFETNYDGWYANADAVSMTAKAGIGHKDSRIFPLYKSLFIVFGFTSKLQNSFI